MPATHLKIFAVDDDPVDQELLRRYLEEVRGYDIELRCLNGLEADFEETLAQPAEVIFLDYLLGKDNGLNKLRVV